MRVSSLVVLVASSLLTSAANAQMVTAVSVTPAPGYYRFENSNFMVIRSDGTLLTEDEVKSVNQLLDGCSTQVQEQAPEPSTEEEKGVLVDAFRVCVNYMLDDALYDHEFSRGYQIMENAPTRAYQNTKIPAAYDQTPY